MAGVFCFKAIHGAISIAPKKHYLYKSWFKFHFIKRSIWLQTY